MKVLLTGSSGSLGSFLAQSLLKDGEIVLGIDSKMPSSEFVASLTEQQSLNWRFCQCDLTNPDAIVTALDENGMIPDAVINNAGLLYSAPLLRFDGGKLTPHGAADWNKAIGINLDAVFYVLAQCAHKMVMGGKKGVIINISSISAEGNVGQAAYSAAKAGVNAITAVAAKELGSFGIRVAAIAPGFFDTESTRKAVSEDALARIRKTVPLGRLGHPKHFYHAVRFVLENDYFHGKVLELDGGLTL